jgi:hypothetical protein
MCLLVGPPAGRDSSWIVVHAGVDVSVPALGVLRTDIAYILYELGSARRQTDVRVVASLSPVDAGRGLGAALGEQLSEGTC